MWFVEQIIREAMERGEFDNLSGAGKPIDLSSYFDLPEEVRLAYSLLKNANILPEEVELLREIAMLSEQARTEPDIARRQALLRAVEDKRLRFHLLLERGNARAQRLK